MVGWDLLWVLRFLFFGLGLLLLYILLFMMKFCHFDIPNEFNSTNFLKCDISLGMVSHSDWDQY